LVTTIAERDAVAAISWAADLIDEGVAEEYGLGATTLEDAYIRLTGSAAENGNSGA
jgi:ABC-2 type transport system ATP-binding protein